MKANQKAESRKQKSPIAIVAVVCCVLFVFCVPLVAKNNAFRQTAHGDLQKGPQRLKGQQRGSCIQCHDQHKSHKETGAGNNKAGLFAPNDNELCFSCHSGQTAIGEFAGSAYWTQSAHGSSPDMVRPKRDSADVNKCLNCHDPHGVRDQQGVIPAMLTDRETDLCLDCHDGMRAADIRTQLAQPYTHGFRTMGQHDPHESDDPTRFGVSPVNNRHVSCSDCHNIHRSRRDRRPPTAPDVPGALAGVSRVEVANGSAGTIPVYHFRAADYPGTAAEFEVCFKCHSSWTKLPPGRPDLARLTNPANPSTHPIQARAKDTRIAPESFTRNWSADSMVYCSDCHASDDPVTRGPHGSRYQYLLKKASATTTVSQTPSRDDLCFDCHAFDVYGNRTSSEIVQQASRFNLPASSGHDFHVGAQEIPCISCHESHGSMRYPSLIATGRVPGIVSYVQTRSGGTCTPTCHSAKAYTLNYPR